MQTTHPSVPEILTRAASLIETEGHWRGGSDLAGHDALGAIESQLGALEMSEAEYLRGECETALARFLGWPETSSDLYRWNDGADAPIVCSTLRRAALWLSADATSSQEGAA